MKEKPIYFLVESSVLPTIFLKVIETKKLLRQGKAKTIHEAVEKTGISRSAYYKYKDSVQPFSEAAADKIITIHAVLKDEPGVLSSILNAVARSGSNVITINQNIPVNGTANITLSVRTGNLKMKFERLMEKLGEIDGVLKAEVLSSEQ
jgi:chorismate mutase